MRGRFEGRVAIVTGAAHGIGRATAVRLASEGASIGMLDRDGSALESLAAELGTEKSLAMGCDILSSAQVHEAVGAVAERFGRVDALAAVAGGSEAADDPLDEGHWRRILDLNLESAARLVRASLPHLEATSGSVVLTGSVNGLAAYGEPAYAAAKAGLVLLARNLAVLHGGAGVRVNVVAPGTIRTRVWDGQPGGADRLAPLYPLGRVGEPEEVAAAIAFLASDDASFITGVTLPVDGGSLAGPLQSLLRD